jgi:copper chaperone CopZ
MVKQIFSVEMHCTACVMRLEGLEDDLPAIKHIHASYQKQQLEVEFDASQVTETQIKAAAAKKGYTLTAVSA